MKLYKNMLNYLFIVFLLFVPIVSSFDRSLALQPKLGNTDSLSNTNATTLTVLVVLMELSDDPHHPSHTPEYYQDLFFSYSADTVQQYYLNVSYGDVTLTGDVIGWKTANNTKSYYGQGERIPPGQDVWPDELVYEAYLYAMDEGKDPTSYDLFVVLHSGDGQEYSGDSDDIWSHKWALYRFGLSNVEYTMNHEYVGYETPSHELGHALYFPDLYDFRNYEHTFAGPYCMMDSGDGHFSIWNKYYSRVSRSDSAQFLTSDYRLQITNYSEDVIATVNPIAIDTPSGIMWIEVGWDSSGFTNSEHGRGWTITVRENLDYDRYLPKHGVVMAEIQVGPRSSEIQVGEDVYPPWNVIDAHPETSENKDDAAFSLNDGDITTYVSGEGWAAQLLEKYSNLSYRIRITNQSKIPQVSIVNTDTTLSGISTIIVQSNVSSGNTIEHAEISIDNGPWLSCQAISGQDGNFSYSWDTTNYREGSHLLRARAFDNASTPYVGYSETKTFNVDNVNGTILIIDDDLGRDSESYILQALDDLGLKSHYEVFQTSSFTQAEVSPYDLRNYNLTIWVGNPAITPLSNSHINFEEFLVIKNYLLDSPADIKPRIIFLSSYNIFDFSMQGSDVETETSKIFKATSPVNFRAPVSTLRGTYFLSDLPSFTLGSTASLRANRSSDGEVVDLLPNAVPILIDENPAFQGYDTKGYYVDTDEYRILNYLFQPEMVPYDILQDLIELSIDFMIDVEEVTYTTTTTTTTAMSTTTTSSQGIASQPGLFDNLDPTFVTISFFGGLGLVAFFGLKFFRKGPKKTESYWLKKE